MDQQGHCLPCCIAAILLYCILDLAILCSTQLAQTVAQEKRAGKANKLSAWQFSTQVYREPTTHHLNIYLYLYASTHYHTETHLLYPGQQESLTLLMRSALNWWRSLAYTRSMTASPSWFLGWQGPVSQSSWGPKPTGWASLLMWD